MNIRKFLTTAIVICCAHLSILGCPDGEKEGNDTKPKKYIAFSTDTEAYFMPRNFEIFQGEFTGHIVEV